jgi:iron complex outermembrane receptor protein
LATPASRTTLGVYLAGTRNHIEQPGALTWAEFEADPRQADPGFVTNNTRRENTLGRIGVRLQQEFRAKDAMIITTVLGTEESAPVRAWNLSRLHALSPRRQRAYKWATPFCESVDMHLNAGVDDQFQDGSQLFYDLGPGGSRGPNLGNNAREGINDFGVFAELAPLRPAVGVSAGGRYDLVHFIYEDHINPVLDDSRTMNNFSPRAAVSYAYRPAHKIYTAISGGMEAPAFNEVNPPPPFNTQTGLNPFLDPARSLTIEVGAKGLRLLADDGKTYFRYDAAIYGLEVRHDIIPFNGGQYYMTAGKTRRAGVELGGELQTRYNVHAPSGRERHAQRVHRLREQPRHVRWQQERRRARLRARCPPRL